MTNYTAKDFGRVAVLMGGQSAEREVSLNTGNNVLASLQKQGIDAFGVDVGPNVSNELINAKADRGFICLHGPGGEDGVIQGVLENLGLPYTGSGVAASAITLDKVYSKWVFQSNNIATPDFVVHDKKELDAKALVQRLGLPLCVKPIVEGSSLGVSRVDVIEDLPKAISHARQYHWPVMIEPWIVGRELTVGILNYRALPVIELKTTTTFYDYKAKYEKGFTEYLCPADLPTDVSDYVRELSLRAFTVTGCHHWGRVDLVLDQNNQPQILEVNTIPGMTDTSLVPKAAKVEGMSFDDCVYQILTSSFKGQ